MIEVRNINFLIAENEMHVFSPLPIGFLFQFFSIFLAT